MVKIKTAFEFGIIEKLTFDIFHTKHKCPQVFTSVLAWTLSPFGTDWLYTYVLSGNTFLPIFATPCILEDLRKKTFHTI